MPKVSVMTFPESVMEEDVSRNYSDKRHKLPQLAGQLSAGIASLLHHDNLLIHSLAFLLGRVSIMGEIAPFGLAYFGAVAFADKRRALPTALWTTLGVLSAGHWAEAGVYLFAILLYCRFADRIPVNHHRRVAVPILIFAGAALGGLALTLSPWRAATLYNALLILFDALLSMVLAYLFTYGLPQLTAGEHHSKTIQIKPEALICTVVMLAIAVAGIGSLSVWGGSVRSAAGSLLIMVIAYVGGAGMGAPAGVLIGLIAGLMEGNVPQAVALAALAGSLGGIFKPLGKVGVALGYILGTFITVLYLSQARELSIVFAETSAAALLFCLLPSQLLAGVQSRINPVPEAGELAAVPLGAAAGKLNNIAETFVDLADAFGQISADTRDKIRDDELARMLSAVGEKICGNCPSRSECWERGFFRTYQAMLEALSAAEAGKLRETNAPAWLQSSCRRLKDVIDTVNSVAERNSIYSFWQKKLAESRQMVTEQIRATGIILGNLASELTKDPSGNTDLGEELRAKAAQLGVSLDEVAVSKDARLEISISKPPCDQQRECLNTLLPLAGNLFQERLVLHAECGTQTGGQRNCRLRLEAANRYEVQTASVAQAKDKLSVSGDSSAVVPLNQGKTALIISDGMGSGVKAANESALALRFLQRLLAVGFDVDVAVKTVNSLLLLRMPDETFATMDMLIIDAYTGEGEFLKIGSAPSYIKRVREVRAVKSCSLPIGILNQIEIEPIKIKLAAGDIVVMVSDGVVDAPRAGIAKEDWLINFLRRYDDGSPQEIADAVLAQALLLSGKELRDDMTVLVARLTEHPGLF